MKKIFYISIYFLFSLCFNNYINAQQDSTTVSWDWYNVVKNDGTSYVAQILSDDGREVLIYTRELGKIFIPKADLKSMKKIENSEQIINGEFLESGPFSTRYYLTTNAFPIKKGENYAIVHLWGPEVHFSVSNKTSLGFMSTWLGSPMGLNIKHSITTKNPNLNFSIGTILGSSGYFNGFRGFGGLHFGNVTYGNRLSNITFSAGFGYMNSGRMEDIYANDFYIQYPESTFPVFPNFINKRVPTRHAGLFSISGITKVGIKASFIFDVIASFANPEIQTSVYKVIQSGYYDVNTGNYVPGINSFSVVTEKTRHTYLIFMPGMRFQSTDKKAFQVAIAGVTTLIENGETITFPLPMCSWFYKF